MNRNDDVELPADWDDDSDAGTERRRGRRRALTPGRGRVGRCGVSGRCG